MSEPIFDPAYWKDKLYDSLRSMERHRAIYNGSKDEFDKIEAYQRDVLRKFVGARTSIVDFGCGYGRLLDLVPRWWRGSYVGYDVSPDLIDVARRIWPTREFIVRDLVNDAIEPRPQCDLSVALWMRSMFLRNGQEHAFLRLLAQMQYASRKVLLIDEDTFHVYDC